MILTDCFVQSQIVIETATCESLALAAILLFTFFITCIRLTA